MEKIVRKDKYRLAEPVKYPPLTQNFERLDTDENKYKSVGKFSFGLLKQNENSIYKLLYEQKEFSTFGGKSHTELIRNDYLKKLVELNNDNFPSELALTKTKKKAALTYEEMFTKKIQKLKEKAKKEGTGKREPLDQNLSVSRKQSLDLQERGDVLQEPANKQKMHVDEVQKNLDESEREDYEEGEGDESFESEVYYRYESGNEGGSSPGYSNFEGVY